MLLMMGLYTRTCRAKNTLIKSPFCIKLAFQIITSVLFSESVDVECFPDMSFKCFFKTFVTIPGAPIITGIIIHFTFSVYINFCILAFSCFLLYDISVRGYCHICQCAHFLFLFLISISGLFAITSLSECTAWFRNTVTFCCSYTGSCVCVCACCLSFQCLGLCILSNTNLYILYSVSVSITSSPKWSIILLLLLLLLFTMGTESFPGVKRPGRGFDHPPHLAPRLKIE